MNGGHNSALCEQTAKVTDITSAHVSLVRAWSAWLTVATREAGKGGQLWAVVSSERGR